MKFHTTITQKRILKNYWQNHAPFTISSLIKKGILHFASLGRITLQLMESRGQVVEYCKCNGEVFYIASTESKMEWSSIWKRKKVFSLLYYDPSQTYLSMNKYEKQKLCEELEKMIFGNSISMIQYKKGIMLYLSGMWWQW